MTFQAYTCGFMVDANGRVALVEKTKPAWQAGLLNGIGGKVEGDENPHACMKREWHEETGDRHLEWDHVCSLNFADAQVHFFRAHVVELPDLPEFNDSSERIVVADALNLPSNVIPNLRWLIPLCLDPNGRIGASLERIAA